MAFGVLGIGFGGWGFGRVGERDLGPSGDGGERKACTVRWLWKHSFFFLEVVYFLFRFLSRQTEI